MAERADFWKGMLTGTVAGLVIAAYAQWDLKWGKATGQELDMAARRLDAHRDLTDRVEDDGYPRRQNTFAGGRLAASSPISSAEDLHLKRDDAEHAGDPSRLTPAHTTIAEMAFQRPGGA